MRFTPIVLGLALSCMAAGGGEILPLPRETAYLYIDPLRIIPLSDGMHFVIRQPHSYVREPEAMTAHVIDPASGASVQTFSVRQALAAPEDILEGTAGQIYGAALLPPRGGHRRLALSAGWKDAQGELRFALLFVREMQGGYWRDDGLVDGIGRAGDLAVTSGGDILAVTSDPAGGTRPFPALTLVSCDGEIRARYFAQPVGIDGGRLFVRARLQSLGNDRFAFHDGLGDVIETFGVDRETTLLSERSSIVVPALKDEGSVGHVRGWHLQRDGSVAVVRTEHGTSGAMNRVSMWNRDGALLSEVAEPPLAGAFWSGDELRLVRRGDDRVFFEPALTSAATQ